LREVLDGHDHDTVFCGEQGAWLRRSTMSRRVWRPAVNGSPLHPGPVLENMHFHDLRHTQQTWLIEDDIPEIVQARRLGHRLPGVRGIYSHVTPVMIARVTNALQARRQAGPAPAGTAPRRLHAA
jgi:integrase